MIDLLPELTQGMWRPDASSAAKTLLRALAVGLAAGVGALVALDFAHLIPEQALYAASSSVSPAQARAPAPQHRRVGTHAPFEARGPPPAPARGRQPVLWSGAAQVPSRHGSASRRFDQVGPSAVATAALGLAAVGAGLAAWLLRTRAPSADAWHADAILHGPARPHARHVHFACLAVSTDPDYYFTLNVEPTATAKEIKASYRSMARSMHPDVSPDPDAGERFRRLNEAYAVLSDEKKRRRYDLTGLAVPYNDNPEASVEPTSKWPLLVAGVGLAASIAFGLGVATAVGVWATVAGLARLVGARAVRKAWQWFNPPLE